jgi:putative serine protease PepD
MADESRTDEPLEQPASQPEPPAPAAPPPVPPAGDPVPTVTPVPPIVPVVSPAVPPAEQAPGTGMRPGTAVVVAVILAFVISSFAGLMAGFLGARVATENRLGVAQKATKVTVVPSRTSDPAVAASAVGVPSVVNIDVSMGTASGGSQDLPSEHPTVPIQGNGSGVAYKQTADGSTYVITNNHVVEDAEDLTVRDSTGQSYPATLVGRDPETDIAVVKVDGSIPTIDIGNSGNLVVGQTVVAIGSPFGLEHTVTSGVVSALGRSLPDFADTGGAYPLVDVIQTDAAINPGNSGGALVNTRGQLVGINTAIYSDTGASGGIGFAVPANTAVRVANQLVQGGEITHPFIGVIGTTVNQQLITEEKLSVNEGAYVGEIAKGSGAAKGGVKVGDVITAVDGSPVRSMDDLILLIRRKKVGDEVTLSLVRGDKKMQVKVLVGDKPAEYSTPSTEPTKTK